MFVDDKSSYIIRFECIYTTVCVQRYTWHHQCAVTVVVHYSSIYQQRTFSPNVHKRGEITTMDSVEQPNLVEVCCSIDRYVE